MKKDTWRFNRKQWQKTFSKMETEELKIQYAEFHKIPNCSHLSVIRKELESRGIVLT